MRSVAAEGSFAKQKVSKRDKPARLDYDVLGAAKKAPSNSLTKFSSSASALDSVKRSPTRNKGGSPHLEIVPDNSAHKNVKEIILNRGRQGAKKSKNQTSSFHYSILCASLALIILLAFASFTPYLNSSVKYAQHRKPKDSNATTTTNSADPSESSAAASNKYPNYEEYIVLATKQKYFPADPIAKIISTIQKYTQIFEVQEHNVEDSIEMYISTLEKETRILLEVFRQTVVEDPARRLDLTVVLYHAVDVIHKAAYSIMKHRLRANHSTILTQSAILQMTSHWVYSPIRDLLKLSSILPNNIVLDIGRSMAAGHTHTLTKVVQFKLYGLVSVLGSLRSDLVLKMLPIAVVNGDDLAVALLLRVFDMRPSKEPLEQDSEQEVLPDLLMAANLAAELRYSHIERRLRTRIVEGSANLTQLKIVNEFAPSTVVQSLFTFPNTSQPSSQQNSKNIFGGILRALNKRQSPRPKESVAEDDNLRPDGFHPLTISLEEHHVRVCDVPRIALSDLTAKAFGDKYLRKNVPVLLELDAGRSWDEFGWNPTTLEEKFGDVQVSFGRIPYSALFGLNQKTSSLRDFLSSMRAYTNKLTDFSREFRAETAVGEVVHRINTSVLEKWLQNNSSVPQLPDYLFADDTQEINVAMAATMREMVAHFSATAKSDVAAVGLETLLSTAAASAIDAEVKASLRYQLYLGPALAGAPFHHHGPAFNLLVRGRKRWTLLPPGRDIYSNLHPLEWTFGGGEHHPEYPFRSNSSGNSSSSSSLSKAEEDSEGGPCHVLQQAGQLLFVPRHWSHQVLNLAESMGFAVEVPDYIF